VDILKQMLTLEANQHPGFTIQVGTLGCFPNPRHPRIIWVGLQAPAGLNALQHNIESAAAKLGYPREERPFSPHLTIGRVRESVTTTELQSLRAALEDNQVGTLGKMAVKTIELFKSDLKPGGAIYTRLHTALLQQ
jgi:2'-5' RNA ligase